MQYKHRDIVIAYVDGKQIQVNCGSDGWIDIPKFNHKNGFMTAFCNQNEYRIKPEGKYFRVYKDRYGNPSCLYAKNADTAERVNMALEESSFFSGWLSEWTEYTD